ncbi:MAG: hypothetical protein WDM70_02340 [Nitrosomonadales bacterium]
MDPTGEVCVADPAMVEKAIKGILVPLYGNKFDLKLFSTAINDLVKAYRGDYPGLLRCDTLYHDLRHALETGLTTARLLDGYAKSLTLGMRENTSMLIMPCWLCCSRYSTISGCSGTNRRRICGGLC